MIGLSPYPMILVAWEYKRQLRLTVNFVIVAIIYVLHQISAEYKNKQHKTWQNYTVQ